MVSTKESMKEVQMVEEERKVLEDVGNTLEAKVVEDLICYDLNEPSSNHFFLTGSNLTKQKRIVLIENIEVFSWTSYEISRIDPDFIKNKPMSL